MSEIIYGGPLYSSIHGGHLYSFEERWKGTIRLFAGYRYFSADTTGRIDGWELIHSGMKIWVSGLMPERSES